MTDTDIGDDLTITKTTRRAAVRGTWVCGALNGYRFEALVFPAHAENPEYELGSSRISKLWLQRIADSKVVFNFDRGLDVSAQGDETHAVLDFLCAGLADYVYPAAVEDTGSR